MKRIIIYIPWVLLVAIIIPLIWKYFIHRNESENFNLNKIRNLELKGNYYFSYKVSGEPYDILQIFYKEYDFYNTDTWRDSSFRFWAVRSNRVPDGLDIVVTVFEFGKYRSEYVAVHYQLWLSLFAPFYHVENTYVKQLDAKRDIEKFKNDFFSDSVYDFYNKKVAVGELDKNDQGSSTYYVEFRTKGQYSRIRIPENFSLNDTITEGNRKLKWLFENVEKEFGLDLFTGNLRSE